MSDPDLPTCPRCGGTWGKDLTCIMCTDSNGTAREVPSVIDEPPVRMKYSAAEIAACYGVTVDDECPVVTLTFPSWVPA